MLSYFLWCVRVCKIHVIGSSAKGRFILLAQHFLRIQHFEPSLLIQRPKTSTGLIKTQAWLLMLPSTQQTWDDENWNTKYSISTLMLHFVAWALYWQMHPICFGATSSTFIISSLKRTPPITLSLVPLWLLIGTLYASIYHHDIHSQTDILPP